MKVFLLPVMCITQKSENLSNVNYEFRFNMISKLYEQIFLNVGMLKMLNLTISKVRMELLIIIPQYRIKQ